MLPKNILAAAHAAERARNAAMTLASTNVLDGLQNAEWLLRECHRFAMSVAESKTITPEDITGLLSSILGFEARCRSVSIDIRKNDIEGYNRRLAD